MTSTADICVVGAGPAGSFCAGLLARAGADVIVVGPHGSTPPTPLQSLAPAALALLDDEGVDLAGAVTRVPIHVNWPTRDRTPAATEASSLLVDRTAFDSAVLSWAVLGGARLWDARVDARPTVDAHGVSTLRVGPRALTARRVLNAAGAHSVFATRRVRVGSPLFGLVATLSVDIDPGVHVDATREGWIWLASAGRGRLSVLTTHTTAPPRRAAADAMREVLSASTLEPAQRAGRSVSGAELRPMDLTATLAAPDDAAQQIGDAALTVDPLAGQGLAVALRSAAQVADLLSNGIPLVRSSEQVSATHAQLARSYYEQAADHFDTSFWHGMVSVVH